MRPDSTPVKIRLPPISDAAVVEIYDFLCNFLRLFESHYGGPIHTFTRIVPSTTPSSTHRPRNPRPTTHLSDPQTRSTTTPSAFIADGVSLHDQLASTPSLCVNIGASNSVTALNSLARLTAEAIPKGYFLRGSELGAQRPCLSNKQFRSWLRTI